MFYYIRYLSYYIIIFILKTEKVVKKLEPFRKSQSKMTIIFHGESFLTVGDADWLS